MGGICRSDGKKRSAFKILLGETFGKQPLGKPKNEIGGYNKASLSSSLYRSLHFPASLLQP
jgi:hypothetical protein